MGTGRGACRGHFPRVCDRDFGAASRRDRQGETQAQVEVNEPTDTGTVRGRDPHDLAERFDLIAPGGVERLAAEGPTVAYQWSSRRIRSRATSERSATRPPHSIRIEVARDRRSAGRASRSRLTFSPMPITAARPGLASGAEAASWPSRAARPGCRRSSGRRRGRRWAT